MPPRGAGWAESSTPAGRAVRSHKTVCCGSCPSPPIRITGPWLKWLNGWPKPVAIPVIASGAVGVSLISPASANWRQLLGHRQVTDAYLLAVAVAEGGRFVSFDQRISVDLVPQARPEQLVVIESE